MIKKLFPLIGIVIFIFILLNINLQKLVQIILNSNPFLLMVAIVTTIVAIFIRALKWQILIKKTNTHIPVLKTFKYYLIGIATGLFTPGRAGDFIKAFYIKKETNSLSKSFATVVFDRLADIGILLITGAVAIIVFSQIFNESIIYYSSLAVAIGIFILGIMVLLNKNVLKQILKPVFHKIIPEKQKEKLKTGFNSFFEAIQEMVESKKTIILVIILGIISWTLSIISAYFLGLSLGLEIPLYFMFLVIPVITLLDLVPISISGIGTRDAALIFMFSFISLTAEQAVSFSFFYLITLVWLIALIGWLLFSTEKIDTSKIL